MSPTRTCLLLGMTLLAPATPWLAAGRSDRPAAPDDEERRYELATAERTWRENCLMCHSAEMTASQRMSPAQWEANVEKMVGWGAPVPPEDRPRLVAYLAEQYGPDRPAEGPRQLDRGSTDGLKRPPAAAEKLAAGPPAAAPLFVTHCASCHGPDARGGDLGTNLVLHPSLLDPAAFDTVVSDGLRRMPGFAGVLDGPQRRLLLDWLRSLHHPPRD